MYSQYLENNQVMYDNVSSESVVDNELIKAYIGKNADKLMDGSFSFGTFFMGPMYVLYRKMWILGALWWAGNSIVSNFLSSTFLSSIISLTARIVLAVLFKKIYLEAALKNVRLLVAENPDKSKADLLLLVSQKGGVAIWPLVIYIVGILVLIVALIVFLFVLLPLMFME